MSAFAFTDLSMRHLIRLMVSLLLTYPVVVYADSKPLPSDVRVIVDISGSMKKTDPTNLRKPAVDLIVRLLPDKSKAGIWTFGQSVNMLMPHRLVDEQWRKEGAQKAKEINSVGMFTNIGAALETASEDYLNPSKDYRTNIILLTDGVVDISKEASDNLAERKRVLTELLPRLKSAGYTIHTIALSDASDQELMKKLSLATDGVFEVAESADELMSTFLRIFDQAVPAERVPLDDNGFLVDSSIQEFTALIFRKAAVPATVIIAPDGKEYGATDPQNNVNWYKTDKYDLITVQQPQAGQWKVKTEMAPNSRVTIVSNLQLVVTPPKNNIKRNQSLELVYSFQENNKTITTREFLSLLSAEALTAKIGEQQSLQHNITSTSIPGDGVFRASLNAFAQGGSYDVHVTVDGKTFKREFIHHLTVSDSLFKLEKNITEENGKKTYQYKLNADVEAVDVANTKVTAIIKNSKDANLDKELNTIAKDHWEFSFSPVQIAKYTISMQAVGKEIDGAPLAETIVAEEFYYPDEATVKAEEEKLANPEKEEPAVEPKPEEKVEPVAEEKPAEEPNNLLLYIGIGLGNLMVIVLGYFAYRLISSRNAKDELDEIEKTLTADVSQLKAAPAAKTEKTVIDVSEEDQSIHIPMNESAIAGSSTKSTSADDSMADNLFPLDNMEESSDTKDKG